MQLLNDPGFLTKFARKWLLKPLRQPIRPFGISSGFSDNFKIAIGDRSVRCPPRPRMRCAGLHPDSAVELAFHGSSGSEDDPRGSWRTLLSPPAARSGCRTAPKRGLNAVKFSPEFLIRKLLNKEVNLLYASTRRGLVRHEGEKDSCASQRLWGGNPTIHIETYRDWRLAHESKRF